MLTLLVVLAAHGGVCTGIPLQESLARHKRLDPQSAGSWYELAPCVEGLGFPHVAERAWLAGLAVETNHAREAEMLDELRRLADLSGDDHWLSEAAGRAKPVGDLFPATRSRLAFVEGRRLAEAGEAQAALDALKGVDVAQSHGPEARIHAARAAFSLDMDKSAAIALVEGYNAERERQRTNWREQALLLDLTLVTIGRLYLDVQADQAGAFLVQVTDDSPLYAESLALQAWVDPKLAKKAQKEAREGWVPDAALLPGSTPEATRATWTAHRDAIAAFLGAHGSDPKAAVAAWMRAPYAPIEADLAANLAWSRASAALAQLATERAAIDTRWGPLATWLAAELDAAEPYLQERAGHALIDALEARRAQAEGVLAQIDAPTKAPLPWSAYDWGM